LFFYLFYDPKPYQSTISNPLHYIFGRKVLKFHSMIDLHTHSTASDGSLSPAALVEEGVRQGLSYLALTDHDTIGGLKEAEQAASEAGIGFIPGIELEIAWNQESGGVFHLLGLGIRRPSLGFLTAVAELTRRREARNREILNRMHELDIEASYEDIQALAGGHSVGRPHFADFLTNRRIVKNREQAFARYLARGKPLYAPKAGLEFDHAAAVIRESGGIAVLAHPMSLFVAWGCLPELIRDLKEQGLEGLEAWHPAARVKDCQRLEELGGTLGLYVTAGSDFHGEGRRDRRLGITAGGRKIEESVLEAIPAISNSK
jgi:predicted metal-dependent phosphoesterase TrpH